jgi:TonB dependent receptor
MGPNNFQRFNQGANAQLTSTLSPSMVLTTRFGFTQHVFENIMFGGSYDPAQLGFPASQVQQAQGQFFPTLSFTNYTGFGQGGNNADKSTNWYFNMAASKVLGSHSLKFGGEYRVLLDNLPNYSFATFAFSNQWTQRDANNGDVQSGNAIASFLLGNPASGSSPYNASPAFGSHYYGFYVQDDWRINNKLTINIGGRWDYDSPLSERYNRVNSGFDATATSPLQAPGLQVKGGLLFTSADNRLPWARDLNNFQPRLGIAYHFLKHTVFRAGYGLSYVPTFATGQTQGFSSSTPYVPSADGGVLVPSGHLSNPFPAGILRPTGSSAGLATFAGQSITYTNPRRTIPYINQFSVGFQHELPFHILIDTSYVGSRTYGLGVGKGIDEISADQLALGTAYLNTSVPNPFVGLLPGTTINGANVQRRQLLRPYPQFTGITRNELSVGTGWYNSLQFQLQKRLSHGFHLLLNYTWSETMEAANYLNAQYPDTALERVRVSEDLPHRTSILAGYELPFFKGSKGLKRALFGGWQAQLIALFQSGRQLNGVDAIPTGIDPFNSDAKVPNGYYFNACSLNTAGVRQNCVSTSQPVAWIQRQSDTLRVVSTRWQQIREMRPGVMDSSFFKTFIISEGVKLQFRMEAFNTFNTPWFGQANTTFGNARFGQLGNTQTNDPRNTQVALKLTF